MTKKLMRLLHSRGKSVADLAAVIGSGRSHVQQVLSNVAGRGGQTRRKLAALLTKEEIGELGWSFEQKETKGTKEDGATDIAGSPIPRFTDSANKEAA